MTIGRGIPPQAELSNIKPEKARLIGTTIAELNQLGRVKTDFEVEERIQQYFDICNDKGLRPGIEGLAFALGVTRQTLFYWARGQGCSEVRQEIIQRAKQGITAYIEAGFLSGSISPVSGIFALKNYSNWRDNKPLEETDTSESLEYMRMPVNKQRIAEQLGVDLEASETDDQF